MKFSKQTLGFIVASIMIVSWNAQSMEPSSKLVPKSKKEEITISILGKIKSDCPTLEDLKEFVPELKDKGLKISKEQGGNSTVYFTNDSVIKISKKVEKYDENSEGNKALKASEDMSLLENPIFQFVPPTKVINLRSRDEQRVCDIQIAPIAQGQKINDYVYKYVDGRSKDNSVFEKLGKALAQFQTNNLIDNLDYGPQHGDFQVGNIFYNEKNETFSLIDLSDFNRSGLLILDPIYFVYFLPHMWGPPKNDPRSNQEFFRDQYNNDLSFRERIKNIIYSFFKGYVTNLPKDVKDKMYEYLNNTKNPGFTAFDFEAKKNGLYGQDLQNIESMAILETLIKGAFVTAFELSTQPQTAQPSVGRSINRSNVPEGWGSNQPSSGKQLTKLSWKGKNIKSNEKDPMGLWKLETEGNLEELDLSNNPDIKFLDALGKLQNLKSLKIVNLSGTGVEAVYTLTPLANLTNLDLSNNKNLYNAMPLIELKNLKILNLSNTNVDLDQVKKLKIILPECKIIR